MNPNDILKACAELDGWNHHPANKDSFGVYYNEFWQKEHNTTRTLPPYTTSYDAIIPLIQKQFTKNSWHCFSDALGILCAKETADVDGQYVYEGDGSYYEDRLRFNASPAQLCEALLRATGKWIE
jgi:hypothetical protein